MPTNEVVVDSIQAWVVITAFRACGWQVYKQTHHFVYLRCDAVAVTVAVCKRTGYYSWYPQSLADSPLYLAIAQLLAQQNPELAQQMTVVELARLMASSQAAMDETKPGQVSTVEDMVRLACVTRKVSA
jgi:hypothetical protein